MTDALRFVLGDQLSRNLSSLRGIDRERDIVLIAEVADEATHVPHHKKKIAFLFSAMRHFAEELRRDGIRVGFVPLDAPDNTGSLRGERWAEGRKQLRMEFFYREMRRRYGILLDAEGGPEGGRWNLDAENRKPPSGDLQAPYPMRFSPDATTKEVLDLVGRRFAGHFGDLEPFWFATTRTQARRAFTHFVKTTLPRFGDYQDAMLQGEDYLFHAAISQYLNAGLLQPEELCHEAEAAYRQGHAPLNAVEGFIRQILGWREFVRGIYWLKMPHYARLNHLNARRPIPDFYWTGETEMNCLATVIDQTRREALSHHIQRLMVTGNFALLAGIRPEDINLWYLVVYADAFEWVELPNVHGMAIFADGGYLASKPYAAGGNYINKMSDFCKHCRYDVKKKSGEQACPFNYLYWNFMLEHRDRLEANQRLNFVYKTLDNMSNKHIQAIRRDSRRFLDSLSPWRRSEAA